jgi:RNA polymerase sigma factor (sigma-70 family)
MALARRRSCAADGTDATEDQRMNRTRRRHRRETAEEAVLRVVQLHATELLRFAQRYSWCADDAHDAYQRALEILVRRMRTEPPDRPLPWLRSIIKNEALVLRAQRQQLLARRPVDPDRQAAQLADPVERAINFQRLEHTAEALQRLKPQELTALLLRAEGLSYQEIAERQDWTYTKVNRAVTEGRRALLARLGAIESGAECARWLPLLSRLADGEAGADELHELRPHLRACPGCRALLRELHRVPRDVAALVPPALVPLAGGPDVVVRHVETAVHALLARTTSAVVRVQGALDALPGAKLAAVAASGAAIAGGGVAIQDVARHPAPSVAAVRAADAPAPVADRVRTVAAPPSRAARPAERRARPQAAEFAVEPSSPTTTPAAAPPPSPPPGGSQAEFAGP